MANLEGVAAALEMIRQDCESDVAKWEGQIATAAAVAQMHGETLAMIDTLARCLQEIVMELRT